MKDQLPQLHLFVDLFLVVMIQPFLLLLTYLTFVAVGVSTVGVIIAPVVPRLGGYLEVSNYSSGGSQCCSAIMVQGQTDNS